MPLYLNFPFFYTHSSDIKPFCLYFSHLVNEFLSPFPPSLKKSILTLLVFLSVLPFCGAQQISLEEMTVQQLQTAYKTGKMTIPQVTKWYLDRIKAIDQAGP